MWNVAVALELRWRDDAHVTIHYINKKQFVARRDTLRPGVEKRNNLRHGVRMPWLTLCVTR